MSGHMPRKLPKSTSDDSHLAGDSEQSENKDFAGMAAEVTESTSDDTHLADDSHCHQEMDLTAVSTVLRDGIFISKIICLLGLHLDEEGGVWKKNGHWTKLGCGQSCPCCRAHTIGNWHFGGCEACVDMWYLMTVNRQWMNLTKEFDGITETRSRRCNKRQRYV